MKIRPARVEDALAMARVLIDTFMATNRETMSAEAYQKRQQEWTYEVSARNWASFLSEIANGEQPRCCVYVAEGETGEVIGLADGCPSKTPGDGEEVGELDVLYVAESHQRQGVGRALVQTVAADLADKGMPTLHICTPVVATEARRFYERLGGRAIGTRDDDEDGEVVQLVIYEWKEARLLLGGESK